MKHIILTFSFLPTIFVRHWVPTSYVWLIKLLIIFYWIKMYFRTLRCVMWHRHVLKFRNKSSRWNKTIAIEKYRIGRPVRVRGSNKSHRPMFRPRPKSVSYTPALPMAPPSHGPLFYTCPPSVDIHFHRTVAVTDQIPKRMTALNYEWTMPEVLRHPLALRPPTVGIHLTSKYDGEIFFGSSSIHPTWMSKQWIL